MKTFQLILSASKSIKAHGGIFQLFYFDISVKMTQIKEGSRMEHFDDWKSEDLGAKTSDPNYTPGVDFLGRSFFGP